VQTDKIFAEWCGLIDNQENTLLKINEKIYTDHLFGDFVMLNPDFGATGKRKLSRTRFNKWLLAYGVYTQNIEPETNRDKQGKWIRIKPREEGEVQQELVF
jgi:hypothetical protein